MDFRLTRGQGAVGFRAEIVRATRNFGLGAFVCALLGTSVAAQTTLDFIDPLDTERVRIEERGEAPARATEARDPPPARVGAAPGRDGDTILVRARDGAASGTDAVRDGATGFWGTLRTALTSIAAALGLPMLGLIALLGLMVAAFAALVGWTMFRGRRRPRRERSADDVYARSSRDAVKRRAMGGAVKTRPAATVEQEDAFEETMPEDFDAIFSEETAPPARGTPREEGPAPARWRKPNLDRLRDSIKADWKADKAEKAESRPRVAAGAASFAQPRTPDATDPASRRLDDLSDGWEEWDAQDKPEDDPWGETLPVRAPDDRRDGGGDDEADDTATSRIRALRESLRAS